MKTFDVSITLNGLRMAPSQTWGSIRLIPLIRQDIESGEGLRIDRRDYGAGSRIVPLSHHARGVKEGYIAYIPYGLILHYDEDGRPAPAPGTVLGGRSCRAMHEQSRFLGLKRMVRKENRGVRLLPLHAAMEGFLALHFGGPDLVHSCWTQDHLSPRIERVFHGEGIQGLKDALRLFEIHDNQVGMAVFVADALASVTVVSHPDDYRMLHRALIHDFFGEVMMHYGYLYKDTPRYPLKLDDRGVKSLDDLVQAYAHARKEWDAWRGQMAGGVFGRKVAAKNLRKVGPYQLRRFMTPLEEQDEHHIGEMILDDDGRLLYAKTFRLDPAQVSRGRLLTRLAHADWSLERAAQADGCTLKAFIERLINHELGYLLNRRWVNETIHQNT